MKPRCILCRKPVPDNHTRCVKHWLNNQDQWMEDDQPVHEHCTPRRRPAAKKALAAVNAMKTKEQQ